jgi:hypothetical protein
MEGTMKVEWIQLHAADIGPISDTRDILDWVKQPDDATKDDRRQRNPRHRRSSLEDLVEQESLEEPPMPNNEAPPIDGERGRAINITV